MEIPSPFQFHEDGFDACQSHMRWAATKKQSRRKSTDKIDLNSSSPIKHLPAGNCFADDWKKAPCTVL
eukprot:761043-Hanusia_phi.AAC.2